MLQWVICKRNSRLVYNTQANRSFSKSRLRQAKLQRRWKRQRATTVLIHRVVPVIIPIRVVEQKNQVRQKNQNRKIQDGLFASSLQQVLDLYRQMWRTLLPAPPEAKITILTMPGIIRQHCLRVWASNLPKMK